GDLAVARRDHAAFAGGDALAGVEAEACQVAEAAHASGADACPQAGGGVLDDLQAATPGDLEDRGDVGGEPDLIDRDDGAGPGGDGRLDELGVQVVGPG